jgi:hypothetical protein
VELFAANEIAFVHVMNRPANPLISVNQRLLAVRKLLLV